MKMKYKIAVKFYTETKNEEQLNFAYKEIENFMDNYKNFKNVYKFDVNKIYSCSLYDFKFDIPNEILNKKEEFLQFLHQFKFKIADSIFQQGNFNVDLIKYAINKVNKVQMDEDVVEEKIKKDNTLNINGVKIVPGNKVFTEQTSSKLSLFFTITVMLLSIVFIFIHYYLYMKNPLKFFHTFQRNGLVG
jgi:hypothetical protein